MYVILNDEQIQTIGVPKVPLSYHDLIRPMEPSYTGPVRFDIIDAKIAWAEKESEKPYMTRAWCQSSWVAVRPSTACGTAQCIAGDVVIDAYGIDSVVDVRGNKLDVPDRGMIECVKTPNGLETISAEATRLLGLDAYVLADDGFPALFHGGNVVDDLKEIRDRYAKKEGYPLKYT